MRFIRLVVVHGCLSALVPLCATLLITPDAHAQDDPSVEFGLKPYGAFEGGAVDNVNLLNESLNVHIPLVSYPQKGGKLSLSFSVVYLQPTLSYVYDNCTNPNDNRTCNQDWSLTSQEGVTGGGIAIAMDGYPDTNTFTNLGVTGIVTTDGTSHSLAYPSITADGSGYLYSLGTQYVTCPNGKRYQYSVFDKAGNKYLYDTSCGTHFISAADTDGNTIIANYTLINGADVETSMTDTLSRNISLPYTPTTNLTGCTGSLPFGTYAYLWSLPGPNGGTETFKICMAAVTINLPGCQNANDNPTSRCIFEPTGSRIQSIVLPDGTAWTFGYDSSSSPSQYAYGDLTSITFPTGGTLTYSWGNLTTVSSCLNSSIQYMRRGVQTRALNANDGQGSHVWTYSQSLGSGSMPPLTTTVVDPLNNQTVHTITGLSGECYYYETSTGYYWYNQGTQNLLKTVATQYNFQTIQGITSNILPTVVTTTLPNGKVSQVVQSYGLDGPSGVSYGEVTGESDYDYGSGSPGALLRQTLTTYVYESKSSYETANVVAIPASVQIKDGGGTQRSYTTYAYDENNGSPQGAIGNLTSTHKWLSTTGGYLVSSNVYNSNGLVTSSTDPKTNPTSYGYTASSCPANSGYAGSGPTLVTNALNQTTSKCYDLNTGALTKTTDPNNQPTAYSYDGMQRNLSITYPDGGQTLFCYTDTGTETGGATCTSSAPPYEVVVSEKINGTMNRLSYLMVDGVGRQMRQAVTNGEPTAYDETDTCYDGLGRVSFKSYPFQDSGPFTTSRSCGSPELGDSFSHDALSRPTSVTHSDGSTVLTSYTGRASSIQDEGNGTQRVQRISQVDGMGRLASLCEVTSATLTVGITGSTAPAACGQDITATGFLTTYGYDALDDLTSVAQGPLSARTFIYDSLSRLTSSSSPEAGATTYTYDADGNVLTKEDARSITATYAYDALNRITSRAYSDGTPTVSLSYDLSTEWGVNLGSSIGRLSATTAWNGAWVSGEIFAYDSMGRVINNTQCNSSQTCSNGPLSYISYTYDLLGDTTSSTDGEGVTLTNTYNAGGRLTSVTSSMSDSNHPGTLFGYQNPAHYNAAGSLLSVTLGNGINDSRTYDARLRLAGITDGSVYTVSIPTSGGYAPNSDILAANDNVNGNWTYGYDALNRLVSSNQNSGTTTYSYADDRFGNRWNQVVTHGSGTPSSLGFDANNHITGSGVGYDLAGDTTYDGTTTYTYDAEHRVITASNGISGSSSYAYDAEGRRIQKITSAGGTVNFLYDLAGHEIAQTSAGSWQRGEIYAGGRHVATYYGGTTYFTHADWLGTERARSNVSGALCESVTSLPYGDAMTPSGSCGDPSPMHFTGKEHDTETVLENLGARYNSSSMGRFMSPDPGSFGAVNESPQTWNAYAYVNNQTLNETDPDGLDCLYVIGNGVYYNTGNCISGMNGTFVNGTIDPKSASYDSATGTFGVNYTTSNGGPGTFTLQGVHPETTPSDEDRSNAVARGTRMAGYVLDTPNRWRNALFAWEARHPDITAAAALALGLAAGGGEPEEEPDFSTGRNVPVDLKEQLAMQQAKSNPSAGTHLENVTMNDARWPATQGWQKMSQNVNGIEIHYNLNVNTGETADWKFK